MTLRTMPPKRGLVTLSANNSIGDAMSDEIIPLLKIHQYFQGASDEALQDVVRHARVTHHPAGTVVHEADTLLTTVGFVLRGRLKAVHISARGTESLFRMIERGEQFGMMVGALAEPLPIRVVAQEPTTVLRLDYEQAMELTYTWQDLRRLWLKTYAGSLRKLFFGAAPKRAPMMLALIHDSPDTRRAAERLIKRLSDIGERLAVFSDSNQWQGAPDIRFRPLRTNGQDLTMEEIREQVGQWQDANRIIFDVHSYLTPERAARLMELVDRAVYFVAAGCRNSHPALQGHVRRAGPRLARQDQRRLVARERPFRGPHCFGPGRDRLPGFQNRRNAAPASLGPIGGQWAGAVSPRSARCAHPRPCPWGWGRRGACPISANSRPSRTMASWST